MSLAPSDYPRSNVRVVRPLTLASFYGCQPCADGDHGTVEDGLCACCRWEPSLKAGDVL